MYKPAEGLRSACPTSPRNRLNLSGGQNPRLHVSLPATRVAAERMTVMYSH